MAVSASIFGTGLWILASLGLSVKLLRQLRPECRQYGTEYVSGEEAAHAAGRGLWSGSFQAPADWRNERKIKQLQQVLARSSDHSTPAAPVR